MFRSKLDFESLSEKHISLHTPTVDQLANLSSILAAEGRRSRMPSFVVTGHLGP